MVSFEELTSTKKHQKLISNHQKKTRDTLNLKIIHDVSLLSKRQARKILKVGNETINHLIKNCEIKTIKINKREKIPYISLMEFILKNQKQDDTEKTKYENIDEINSISEANNIINEVLKEFK